MAQPTPYAPITDFSQEETNQVSGRSAVRTQQLDNEFDNIALTLSELLLNMALLQRDDGALNDSIVTLQTLSADVLALMVSTGSVVRGNWAQGTDYAYRDIVETAGASYICVTAHTSSPLFQTDKDLGYWIILSSTASAATTSFAPTANILATTVQAAIAELDADLRFATNLSLYRPQLGV
jgi:hypothetical protein